MHLLIDAGNTRTKWAIFDAHGKVFKKGAWMNGAFNIDAFNNAGLPLKSISCVLISNVAGDAHAKAMQAAFDEHRLQTQWLTSTAECCNVLNRYQHPDTLGTDRWVSLIAAWHLQQKPCVVINAGTAVTIDALLPIANNPLQAEFIGGMILPGLALMRSSLGHAAAQINTTLMPNNTCSYSGTAFNTTTETAICNGSLNAICGAVQNMLNSVFTDYQTHARLILSGGDADILEKRLASIVENPVILVDNLVLDGLYIMHRSQLQQSNKQ